MILICTSPPPNQNPGYTLDFVLNRLRQLLSLKPKFCPSRVSDRSSENSRESEQLGVGSRMMDAAKITEALRKTVDPTHTQEANAYLDAVHTPLLSPLTATPTLSSPWVFLRAKAQQFDVSSLGGKLPSTLFVLQSVESWFLAV